MAVEKRYLVFHAMTGSFPMLVNKFSDKDLAVEVAAGQPDGSGFAVEVLVDTDPGIAGGMDREVRNELEQAEGRQLRKEREEAQSVPQSRATARDEPSEADRARRVADEQARVEKVVEKAQSKSSDVKVDAPKAEQRQDQRQDQRQAPRQEQRQEPVKVADKK